MSSAFGELTVQAHHLVSAGDLAGAQQLLSEALSDADPRPDQATPEVADAAGLQARVLVALGEPHSARGWAAFAYAATSRLYGRSDPRAVSAAATLAAVLHRVGSYARAARLYSEVVIELTASDGPESLRVLAAHADLATVEYARGQCEVARDRLQDAWELHREVYGDGHPSGIKMLARLGAMQRDCGEFAEAHDHLTLARELCRQHLAPDDPLAVQVAALARAAANPGHLCAATPPVERETRATPAETPAVPAARVPPVDEGPPTYASTWPPQAPTAPTVPAPRAAPEDADPSVGSGATTAFPADHEWPPESLDDDPWPRADATHPDPGLPDDRVPWDRRGDGRESPADQGREGLAHPVDQGRERPAHPSDDGWEGTAQPSDDGRESPAYPVGAGQWPGEPQWRAEDEPPPTVAGPSGGPTKAPAGVHSLHLPAVRPDRSRLLPVVVPRPPAPPRRLTPLVVVGGVTVVVLGTAAVVAGVSRVDGPGPAPSPSPTAAPASGAPGSPRPGPSGRTKASPRAAATPPGGSIGPDAQEVALDRTYPAGASGPVVLLPRRR
ncbi:tetratricopeptide repeat protein [Micromonospora sp. DT233]|uniref:tetratricopeptide repeat protein n=1 Tax=Micromonospora sp. DT233 TaxID=3393432 RepID=UPI003CEBE8A5